MRWWWTGVLALLVGCSQPREPVLPGAGEAAVSVLSYNLNYGMAGDPDTLGVIAELNADLVLLQETTQKWQSVISRELSERYPYMSFRHCCLAGGLAVLSKSAFESHEYLKAPGAWFPAWRIVVETKLGPVQVLNVHLRPQVSDSGSVVSGYFTTGPQRQREITRYYETLEPDMLTIVAGDFNESDSGGAVEFLEHRGFRSVLPEFDPDAATWRWHTSVGRVSAQLDHIVYNDRLEPLSASVVQQGRSDHLPVLATFRKAEQAADARQSTTRAERACSSSLCL